MAELTEDRTEWQISQNDYGRLVELKNDAGLWADTDAFLKRAYDELATARPALSFADIYARIPGILHTFLRMNGRLCIMRMDRDSRRLVTRDLGLDGIRRRVADRIRVWERRAVGEREAIPAGSPRADGMPAQARQREESAMEKAARRQALVNPILHQKGWSVHEWAQTARVDWHTTNNYFNGLRNPNRTSRGKLARALGVPVSELPE